MKKLQLLLLVITTALSIQAQSVEKNLDKLHKHPGTAEKAAKADVYILGHKIMDDSLKAKHQPNQKQKKFRKGNYIKQKKVPA